MRNSEPHLKRVLIIAWYRDISTNNLHTLNVGQLDATFHHGLFLKQHHLYFTCAIRMVDMIQIIIGSLEAKLRDQSSSVSFQMNSQCIIKIVHTYPRTAFRILQVLGVQYKKSFFVVAWRCSFLLLRFFDHHSLQNHPGEHGDCYTQQNEKHWQVLAYRESTSQ